MGLLPQEKIERLILPSTKDKPEAEQEWADINTNPLGGDMLESALALDATNRERGLLTLAGIIRRWSFVNEDGEPEPITGAAVGRLDLEDISFLITMGAKLRASKEGELGEKKDKTSSATLPQSDQTPRAAETAAG